MYFKEKIIQNTKDFVHSSMYLSIYSILFIQDLFQYQTIVKT